MVIYRANGYRHSKAKICNYTLGIELDWFKGNGFLQEAGFFFRFCLETKEGAKSARKIQMLRWIFQVRAQGQRRGVAGFCFCGLLAVLHRATAGALFIASLFVVIWRRRGGINRALGPLERKGGIEKLKR
jgi:hypothetical protein